MGVEHIEVFVEEPSMEAFLTRFLPRHLPDGVTFSVYTHNGKSDLLRKLPDRLRGYSQWIPPTHGIVVIVDKDDDECVQLKQDLEFCFAQAGLRTKCASVGPAFIGLTRIAIEELEAWYFGNWPAVVRSYPRLPVTTVAKAKYRDSDQILGGTWEAFERVCKAHGLFSSGLRKVEAARTIGEQIRFEENNSPSFRAFFEGILSMIEQD